jgi:hypothetical protein
MLLQLKACSLLLCATVACAQQLASRRYTPLEHLDNDTVVLKKTRETLTFLGTWIAPDLAKYERVYTQQGTYIRSIDGQRLMHYPEKMTLRITIGNKTVLHEQKPMEYDTDLSAEELAKQARFRLRIYKGLEYRFVEPQSVRMIGVPKDVPYNERIYMVEFALKHVPIEDRLVIEVLDPNDKRMAKFGISMF